MLETEPQIVETYVATGKARLIYRHLLQLGDESLRAAEASQCAADQGKFWEMRYAIYQGQGDIYRASGLDAALTVFAQDLDLDMGAFSDCMTSHKHLAAVEADYEAALQQNVRARPVFDINGQRLVGAQPFSEFQQAIDAALGR